MDEHDFPGKNLLSTWRHQAKNSLQLPFAPEVVPPRNGTAHQFYWMQVWTPMVSGSHRQCSWTWGPPRAAMVWFNTWCLTCWASTFARFGSKQEHGGREQLAPWRDHGSTKSLAMQWSPWGSSRTVAVLQDKKALPSSWSQLCFLPSGQIHTKMKSTQTLPVSLSLPPQLLHFLGTAAITHSDHF